MDEANTLLPFDLKEICFEDSKELINQTTYTQPAIFVVSQMALALLKEAGIKADVVAGFSLGEYSALCAAHVFNFTEGVSLVAKRGELMGTASNNGKMAALLGLDLQKAQAVCDEASSKGIVELANLNCPGQIVIGGEAQAVTYACEIAKNHVEMSKIKDLTDYFWGQLTKVFGDQVVLNGHPEERLPNTLNVCFVNKIGQNLLDKIPYIAASTGSACHAGRIDLSPVLKEMQVPEEDGVRHGLVRLGLI